MTDSQEHDFHNFSTSPTHRLPTLNGTQALQAALYSRRPISTGLPALDCLLSERDDGDDDDDDDDDDGSADGGIIRGTVTEVYGPPGAGKTTFAVQLVADVLKNDGDAKVVWIDTGAEVSVQRLTDFLKTKSTSSTDGENRPQVTNPSSADFNFADGDQLDHGLDVLENFHHMHVSSFPHLLAFLLHPPQDFPPDGTSLLVLDTLSSVVATGLPRRKHEPVRENLGLSSSMPAHSDAVHPGRLDPANIIAKSLATRRSAMVSSISSGLQQLAASHNIAVVVLNKAATSLNRNAGSKVTLRSAMGSQQWNENIATRFVIYRDHWPVVGWKSVPEEEIETQQEIRSHPLRIVEVERLEGVDVHADAVRFVIFKHGLHAVDAHQSNSVKMKHPVADSPNPVNLDDDESDGLQNLELEELEEDQISTDPEDASVPVSHARSRKRKTMEVEDSEGEGDEIEPIQARLPPMPNARGGFLPSSQLIKDDGSDPESPLVTRTLPSAKDVDPPSGDSDMLLQ